MRRLDRIGLHQTDWTGFYSGFNLYWIPASLSKEGHEACEGEACIPLPLAPMPPKSHTCMRTRASRTGEPVPASGYALSEKTLTLLSPPSGPYDLEVGRR